MTRSQVATLRGRALLLVPAALVAVAGSFLTPALGAQPTDFSGTWSRNSELSQSWQTKLNAAIAPRTDSLDDPDNQPWIQRIERLLEGASRAEIRQTGDEIEIVSGLDEVRIFYFGREHVRENSSGLRIRALARWEEQRLHIEEVTDDGSRIMETIAMAEDGDRLVHLLRWKNPKLRHTLVIRSVYDPINE